VEALLVGMGGAQKRVGGHVTRRSSSDGVDLIPISRIRVQTRDVQVRIGGACVGVAEGTLTI
jgi:hypothetical protein